MCGNNLNIYSGNDDQILPILSLGGIGVISVLSNIKPQLAHDIVFNFLNGNIEKARKLQLNSIPLINLLFSEVNPIPIKAALNILGYDFGAPRPPLTSISEKNLSLLKDILLKSNNSEISSNI